MFFGKQKTAYEMRISDWSSDVCSSDLIAPATDAVGVGRTDIVGGQRRRSDELLAGGDEQFADALVRCLVRGRFRCNIYGWLRLRRYKVRFYLHRALNHRDLHATAVHAHVEGSANGHEATTARLHDERACGIFGHLEQSLAARQYHLPFSAGECDAQLGTGVEGDQAAVTQHDVETLADGCAIVIDAA